MLTRQKVFDTVVEGIVAQGGPAWNEAVSSCVYRRHDGRKCAVGLLLEDGDPAANCNGTVRTLLNENPGILGRLGFRMSKGDKGRHVKFLCKLQQAHDNCAIEKFGGVRNDETFFRTWPTWMRDVARQYRLNTRALKAAGL